MLGIKYIEIICSKEMKNRPQLFPAVLIGHKYNVDIWWWENKSVFDNIPIHLNGKLLEWYPKDLFLIMNEWRDHQLSKIIDEIQ